MTSAGSITAEPAMERRSAMPARMERLLRWEFWPSWAVYAPLWPFLLGWMVRHGSATLPALVNPAFPLGGFVGESKALILGLLPLEHVLPWRVIGPGEAGERLRQVEAAVAAMGRGWPIVLKPDVGERGSGVALVGSVSEAAGYLAREPRAVIAQMYHPGPFEAGVFYMRRPGEPRGRIFSITDKTFPVLTADGRATIRELVERHPRFRLQARVIFEHLGEGAARIPARGERVSLGFAGNHCRGTMFTDGSRLKTSALEAAVDAIAARTPGFYFGRFDLRYADAAAFAEGRGFKIVELNGLLSESTNIYDPAWSFARAQRTLRAQWREAFAIAAANRRAGHRPPGLRAAIAALRARR